MGFLKKFKGVFFGTGKLNVTKSNFKELADNYAMYKPMLLDLIKEYAKNTAQDSLLAYVGSSPTNSDSDNITEMYDYFANYDGSIDQGAVTFASVISLDGKTEAINERISATPLSVMGELDVVPTPFTIEGLADKIRLLQDKELLTSQRYTKAQINGLIKRLENRKKYRDHVEFFTSFPNTTDEKIQQLLSKYKLVFKSSDLFVPTFPKEAIDIMVKYTEVTVTIAEEKPVFYVIAEEEDFKEKFRRKDPILLVQSPFGFYWQILGAWDKEMLLLSEL